MSIKILSRLSREIKHENPYWRYVLDNYELPSGATGEYHYVETEGSTFIIPRLSNGNFVLTQQFRYLNQKISIEFPGGGIKKGYTTIHNAECELREETGYIAGRMYQIGSFNPYNGVTNEICTVFFAADLEQIGSNPEETEQIEIIEVDKYRIREMIANHEIWDGMTLAAWCIFENSKFNEDK